MSIRRENLGDIELYIAVARNGEILKNKDGAANLAQYIRSWEVHESIESASLEASFIFEDSGGLIGTFTGTETIVLRIQTSLIDRKYQFRSYEIKDRARSGQGVEFFRINCTTDEYVKNEVVNVFGHTEELFKTSTETSEIVKTLIKNKDYLNTQKKVFAEETNTPHNFIIPNWRCFDTIYWLCKHTVRAAEKKNVAQNGFVFFENAMGYHFKTIDRLIAEINAQTPEQKTKFKEGKAKLYSYTYSPKNLDQTREADIYKIKNLSFPEERNYLVGLRQGAWAGYTIGFDPVTITKSNYGESEDMPVAKDAYTLDNAWKKMQHLGKNTRNPLEEVDEFVQQTSKISKRTRYCVVPNQVFDQKGQQVPSENYEQLVSLQSYQWMRMQSLKAVQLSVTIPGNLDLYAGYGVDISIPINVPSKKIEMDKVYSGKYMIAAVSHYGNATTMETELYLLKDGIRKVK